MAFNTNYEYFNDKPYAGINPETGANVTTAVTPTALAMNNNNNEIVIKGKDEYDSLYTVDLKFNTDITNMDANVLSDYINRRLANYPYNIDVSKIVSIDVDDKNNKISVTVSNKLVEERLIDLQDTYINLTSIVEDDINKNIYNYSDQNNSQSDKDIKLVNDMIPKEQKYVLNYENPKGEVKLYEYDFDGFEKAKSLNYNKNIIVNGNTKRHFLRNNNDKPYFYDEYIDNENNVNEQKYNSINPEDPMNVKRNLYNQITENELENNIFDNLEKENDNVNNNENNNELNNIFDNSKKENKNQYLNYFIIFLILICVLVIFFILFNYVFKKK